MVKKILAKSYVYLILLLMYVPIIVLIIFSFTNSDNVGTWNGFTLELYPRLFKNEAIMKAVGNTIIIAVISAIVSTVLGTLGAIGTFYAKKRTRAVIENITQIPVVNSEIVIALSLTFMFVFFGTYIFRTEIFSFWTILIGHVVLSVPFVYLNVKPKLTQMDPSLYEAAINLGCSPRQALNKVIFPQIKPGIISGFMLAITLSLDDFIVTAFTSGPGLLSGAGKIETISTFIQSVIKKKVVPNELRALATLIFICVVVATILTTIYQKYQRPEYKMKYKSSDMVIKRNFRILVISTVCLLVTIALVAIILGMF
ncbi:MAG: ABC transporter permease [Bacilli bacterium]|mgnify:FL=1|uniref:ABC transporter permease n=1 Tax=Methanobrevibacter boviskoreani TaxID=1348249 RepID=UPI002A87B5BE|nr:ABC transporter permease [Methanobrevibacter boviskoreani]MCI5542835.1 ABC transporter permease [Mollicutes bacterium]MDD6469280.1 ABC transporter permease [Bacilli bacterium]MDY3761741.1 ABC transporter permease [Candidatus Onthovivens sp.]MCI7040405.1 ABC transporter permease [Mollicutes bacterium]MCI7526954.1 ABC transporter permease [Mollicutes bacterium]